MIFHYIHGYTGIEQRVIALDETKTNILPRVLSIGTMVEHIDISDSDSAEDAARRTADKLKEIAEEDFDQDGDLEVTLRQDDDQWIVAWTGGPYEWTMSLTGGRGLFGGAPSITGFGYQDNFIAEPKNRDALVFTPD